MKITMCWFEKLILFPVFHSFENHCTWPQVERVKFIATLRILLVKMLNCKTFVPENWGDLPVMQVEGAKNIKIAIKQKKFFTIILIEYLKWKYICVKNLFYLDITWNFLFLIAFIKYKCRKSTNFYRVICP